MIVDTKQSKRKLILEHHAIAESLAFNDNGILVGSKGQQYAAIRTVSSPLCGAEVYDAHVRYGSVADFNRVRGHLADAETLAEKAVPGVRVRLMRTKNGVHFQCTEAASQGFFHVGCIRRRDLRDWQDWDERDERHDRDVSACIESNDLNGRFLDLHGNRVRSISKSRQQPYWLLHAWPPKVDLLIAATYCWLGAQEDVSLGWCTAEEAERDSVEVDTAFGRVRVLRGDNLHSGESLRQCLFPTSGGGKAGELN